VPKAGDGLTMMMVGDGAHCADAVAGSAKAAAANSAGRTFVIPMTSNSNQRPSTSTDRILMRARCRAQLTELIDYSSWLTRISRDASGHQRRRKGDTRATSAERVRALRERARRALRRLTIDVSEDDLRTLGERGYEGTASTDHDQQVFSLTRFCQSDHVNTPLQRHV
jgi:hypothetical protein